MQQEEIVHPNDTTEQIRRVIKSINRWKKTVPDNPHRDDRHVAMVLTKLEEAELLSLRIIKHDQPEDN